MIEGVATYFRRHYADRLEPCVHGVAGKCRDCRVERVELLTAELGREVAEFERAEREDRRT